MKLKLFGYYIWGALSGIALSVIIANQYDFSKAWAGYVFFLSSMIIWAVIYGIDMYDDELR